MHNTPEQRKYVLTLFANTGGTASLPYDTHNEALQMRQAFMNTGEYRDAKIEVWSI